MGVDWGAEKRPFLLRTAADGGPERFDMSNLDRVQRGIGSLFGQMLEYHE